MPLTPQQRTRLSHGLQRVARKLDKLLERETGGTRVGFSLVIWGAFGEDHMVQYVSRMRSARTALSTWVIFSPAGKKACPTFPTTKGTER